VRAPVRAALIVGAQPDRLASPSRAPARSRFGNKTAFQRRGARTKVSASYLRRTMPDAAAEIAALSFEQALAELEKIVGALESGQAPLEASIEMYERGAALKAHCERRLDAARLRVEKIVVGPQGVTAEPAEFS